MQKVGNFALKVFFFLGERLALVVLFILAIFVLSFQSSTQAFSETKTDVSSPKVISAESQSVSWVPSTPTPTPNPTETPTPTPTATPTPTPPPVGGPVDPASDDIWNKIADCETHQNWGANTGNGYFGGLQFNQGAWNSVGGNGLPSDASRDEQISRGKMLQANRGWGAWGACARHLGLN